MTRRGLLACVLLATASTAFAAAAAPAGAKVEHAWIRWLPASLPSAGYAVIVNDSDATVRLTGARSVDYGTVMKVMARISSAGYKNLGLVTLQEQDN